ncbi:hypothetical protein J7E83_14290, partial [Arthrobacter sp. ISL-48]|nr:hypothetical protein [Arthrobacter sp. ISL-48]
MPKKPHTWPMSVPFLTAGAPKYAATTTSSTPTQREVAISQPKSPHFVNPLDLWEWRKRWWSQPVNAPPVIDDEQVCQWPAVS